VVLVVLVVLVAAGGVAGGVLPAAAADRAAPPPLALPATPGPPASSTASAWALPLARTGGQPPVVRGFTAPVHRWSPGHRGVDLAAAAGTPVLAPSDGVVTVAGRVVDRDLVVLRGPGGRRSTLEPVTPGVAVGDVVRRGQQVGVVAAFPAHCAPVTCLHWGVRRGETYLDPLLLLRPPRAPVLLPLRGWPAAGAATPVSWASRRAV
jgi:murein DD-endopeptidase MepM/ murein hydrolase activator NlpD